MSPGRAGGLSPPSKAESTGAAYLPPAGCRTGSERENGAAATLRALLATEGEEGARASVGGSVRSAARPPAAGGLSFEADVDCTRVIQERTLSSAALGGRGGVEGGMAQGGAPAGGTAAAPTSHGGGGSRASLAGAAPGVRDLATAACTCMFSLLASGRAAGICTPAGPGCSRSPCAKEGREQVSRRARHLAAAQKQARGANSWRARAPPRARPRSSTADFAAYLRGRGDDGRRRAGWGEHQLSPTPVCVVRCSSWNHHEEQG